MKLCAIFTKHPPNFSVFYTFAEPGAEAEDRGSPLLRGGLHHSDRAPGMSTWSNDFPELPRWRVCRAL